MTARELIEQLEEMAELHGDDIEVRLMTQENWPFENDIRGVCSTEDMRDKSGSEDEPDEDAVYIVEGSQLGYGSKTAWNCCE